MAAPRVAVVGGGLAGSACASLLAAHGALPTLFDLSKRTLGGRASASSVAVEGVAQPLLFDTGCQFVADGGNDALLSMFDGAGSPIGALK